MIAVRVRAPSLRILLDDAADQGSHGHLARCVMRRLTRDVMSNSVFVRRAVAFPSESQLVKP
jgi:hypothetical protein